jgi:hypothetical protein
MNAVQKLASGYFLRINTSGGSLRVTLIVCVGSKCKEYAVNLICIRSLTLCAQRKIRWLQNICFLIGVSCWPGSYYCETCTSSSFHRSQCNSGTWRLFILLIKMSVTIIMKSTCICLCRFCIFLPKCRNAISRFRRVSAGVASSSVEWTDVKYLVSEWDNSVVSSVESHPVKRRPEGWCEVAASLGTSQMSCQLQEICTGGCCKRVWVREAEESPSVEAIARKRLVESVLDCGH